MHHRFILVLRFCLLILLALGITLPPQVVYALTTLTVEPLTWNVIGLDSNDVNVGPNHFPIGARVCNSGGQAATDVTATFNWDSADAFINLRPGTLTSVNLGTLNSGACADAYFEVEVTRNSSAYDHTRDYHISVTAGNVTGTISTSTPRELYVEHLISQSRNTVSDMQYGTSIASLTSVPNGGTMTLMVGNTYYIRLIGSTATQGYEQIESFINFPNTIFQVVSVDTTYSAESSTTLTPPYDQLYGDACDWENDPNSPNYRMCLDVGKAGGNITVTYQVKILQVPAAPLVNPEPLSTLIYDFSGSSFHYNADYDVSTRYANIVNASLIKAFSPKTINPGGTSTLTFTINNPGTVSLTGVNFTDTLPNNVTVASSTVTYSGCGAASPGSLTVGATSLSFSNITVAGLGTCTVAVSVTASTDGTYNNTSGHLFINNTIDTGSIATDTLVVTSKPPAPTSCTTPITLATWTLPIAGQGSGGPPPPYTTKATDVSTATATSTGGTATVPTGGVTTNQWLITGGWNGITSAPTSTSTPYFEFSLDTSNYGGVTINFAYDLEGSGDWAAGNNNFIYVFTQADSGAYTAGTSYLATKGSWQSAANSVTHAATSTGVGTTKFRIVAWGAPSNKPGASVGLDDITITGCPRPALPTLSKTFLTPSIAQGSTSTLSFTLVNPNASTTLTGVGFTDTLPTGLLIASPNGLTSSCTTGTLTGGTTTATSGTTSFSLSSATLSANANCTISINVLGNVAGSYTNISGSITSTETGPNTTNTGYGTSSLTVVAAPVIAKSFSANPIFTGNSTTLSFSITNPNTTTTLTGISFTDTLPAGLDVVNSSSAQCGGTLTVTNNAPAQDMVSLSGGSLGAGATCYINVTVTGSTTGLKTNTVTVSSTNGGTGNTSTADVLVKTPTPAISMLKQVGPTATGPWTSFLTANVGSNVYYRFSVENTGDVTLSNVTVTDPTVSTASCAWKRGDSATAVSSPFTLPVADAVNNHIVTCVLGPITAVSGSHVNTATASGTNGSTVTESSSATYGTPAITIVKSVTQTSFTAAGEILNYSYLVTNTGSAPLLGPVTVSDNKAAVTCPAVSTVGDNDDWFDVGESMTCTANYTVVAADVTAGSVTNTASATASGVTSNTDSETVYGTSNLAITKTDGVTSVNAGGSTIYTIRVTNTGPSSVTGAILSDPLVAELSKTTVACSATPGQCTVGTTPTVAQLESGTFALPTLASGQFYEISVTATVVATSGSATNTVTVNPPAGATDPDLTNNTASDTDTVTPVADLYIAKTNSSASVNAGGTTTYTIRVTNAGPSSVTNAVLSDPAVAGLTKTAVVCSTTPGQCTAPTTPSIVQLESGSFTLPTLASGQFYEIAVTVTVSATSGSITNNATITPPVGTTNSGASCVTGGGITRSFDPATGTCTSSDTDTVTPIVDLSLDKQVSNTSPTVGNTVTFTLMVANAGPSTATNIVVTDVVPSGYTYNVATIAGGDTRSDAAPATTGLTWTINSLASGASVNLTYQATVLGTGTYDNYAEITAHTETDSDSTPNDGSSNDDDDDTQTVTPSAVVAPSISKQFLPNPVAVNGVSTLTFTITNPNAGTILTGVAFTDSLPAGMQVAVAPNATTLGCGAPTFAPAAGNTTLTFSAGTIAASGTCTVSVDVVSTTAGTKTNTTGNVSSTNGGTGNTATAKLGVINAVKSVVSTSEDSTTGTNVAIGEVVRYRLVIELPEGTTTNLQLLDVVVGNLAYLNDGSTRVAFICNNGAACATSSTASIASNPVISGNTVAAPTFVLPAAAITNNDGGATGNPFPDGDDPLFSLGTITNSDNDADAEYVVVEFNSLVRNLLANQDGNSRGNTFTVNVNGSALVASPNVQVTIREPAITGITKSITTTPTDAGDSITYQLQFQNTGNAPAFDIVITDTLNAALTTPVTVTGSTTGGSCGSTASTVSGSYAAPTATATVTCLAAGGTATVNITANVSASALTGYTFTNAASLTYTSLPGATGTTVNPTGSTTPAASGASNGERNGSGGTNDYTASSNTVSTTLDSPSLAKTINPAGTSYAIGTTIPYQITITLPEGVTGGPTASIVEAIPTGLSYVPGSLTVTPQAGVTIGAAGPYTDANASFFNLTGQTMTLTFGSFTSTASAASTSRTVTIAFQARVDNVVGNQSGTNFNNSVDLVRTNPNGAGTLTINATNSAASVVEPDLNVTKTPSTNTPAFNSTLTYTLVIAHTGASNSAAYLLNIRDTLPAGLTGLTNVNISSTTPSGCATGVANTSTASVLNVTINTIPLGCTVTIIYDATVSGAVGSTQTNSVAVAWASTPNGAGVDRTGADGPGGALNDYADTDSKAVTVSGPDFRTVKTDGAATYTPGAPITYTITVNNDGSATANGTVTDTFSASLTGVTWTCTGTGGATCGASGSGNINDPVSIPAGESVTYTINATVAAGATGNLVNTATATLGSGTDPTPGNNSSTDTDTSVDLLPDAVNDTNAATEGGAAVNGNVLTNENSLGDTPTTATSASQGINPITIGSPFTTAAGGTLTINGDGTYSYTPPATLPEGTVLTEVFNYTITDVDGDTDTATLTITVDRLPQANPDTNTASEGGANATGNVITNDDEGNTSATVTAADQGGNAITVGSAFATAAGGTLTLNANGTYTYTPPATLPEGTVLTEVFDYTITDADGDTSSSTLTITVDRLPQANPDTNTATEGGADATGNVIINDDEGDVDANVTAADQGGTVITLGTPFTTSAGGTLTLNGDGTYTYIPPTTLPEGAALTEVFNYTITDADGDTSSSTLTITVDRLPQANPDTNTATEGGADATGNVITNDDEGNVNATVTAAIQGVTPITVGSAFTTAAGGTLTLNADGTYTYTPPAAGSVPPGGLTEVFNYTITDADGDSSSSTLTITVTDVDLLPDAVNDTTTAIEGGANATGNVLTNENSLGDTPTTVTAADQGGTAITVGTPFTTAAGGTLTLNANGTYTYTPPTTLPEGTVLTEVFTYTITDADGDTDTATLTITVDRLPLANPDTNTATEGGADATGTVITNDDEGNVNATVTVADQGGSNITIGTPFTTAAGGTLTLNADGTYTYTPPAINLVPSGGLTEVFNYTITDADGDTSSSTLTITVSDSDLLPDAVNDTNTATEGGVDATGNVLTNENSLGDTPTTVTAVVDDDGDVLTPGVAFTTDAGGTLTLNANGTYTYTPPATLPEGAVLTEVFTYTITDADGDTDTATLTITVDRLPEANPDTDAATEGGPDATGNVITNDDEGNTSATVTAADQGGSAITIGAPFTTAGGGTLTLNANGTYTYTPPATVPPGGLTEVFNYTITDADGDVSSSTLTITVNNIDLLPVATNNSYTIDEGDTASGNVMTDGIPDTLGDPATTVTSYDAVSVNGGTVTVAADGSFTYDPNGFTGTDTFTYTITDADGDTSTATVTITINPSQIGISKRAVSVVEDPANPGRYDVTFELYVENYGSTILNNVQVTDDLNATFPAPTTYIVQSVTSPDFTVNAGFNGNTVTDLLSGTDSLAIGANGTITVVVRVVPANAGPFNNVAVASGQCPTCATPITDTSEDGSNPDPDNDKDPTNNNTPTPVSFGPNLFDPPFGVKTFDAAGIPVLQWTMVWINDSNIVAINAQVTDPIPAGTTYNATGAPSGYPLPAGAPAGSTDIGVSCTDTSASTSTTYCYYEGPTGAFPRGRIVWVGSLGPDFGATDAATAVNEITIVFNLDVPAGITSVQNTATVDYDRNGDGDFSDAQEQRVSRASNIWRTQNNAAGNSTLPATGFAPNVVTDLSDVPYQSYIATGDVTLEIPSLNVRIPVVGVPKKDGTWNVSWLGNQAGWLEGSAFPSWSGNSVLTSHVYMSNGLPGPFVNLGKLKYGDKIVVHAYGQKYTFEVRTNEVVEPNDTTVMKHEDKSWLTLITCKEYDEKANIYRKRVVVRAVLVSVSWE